MINRLFLKNHQTKKNQNIFIWLINNFLILSNAIGTTIINSCTFIYKNKFRNSGLAKPRLTRATTKLIYKISTWIKKHLPKQLVSTISRKRTRQRFVIPILSIAVLFLAGFAIYKSQQPKDVRAGWFNDRWGYRLVVTVNNHSSYDVTQIPYLVELDTTSIISEGKMQTDGDDIRVTDNNGRVVKFQLEKSTINTSNTGIWFEATQEANGTATYYIYYGNPSAETISFNSDVDSIISDGATVEMKDGFGYSTSASHGRLSDIRKDSTNLGVNGTYRHTGSYPGSWWDDRSFTRTLMASGPLFVEVKYSDSDYGSYSSFGTEIKMFKNGFVHNRVFMTYNADGVNESLYHYLHFDSGTRNSVWVDSNDVLVNQAANSGTLYESNLGDNWFGQLWTSSGIYGGNIIIPNISYWASGTTSAQASYYQTNHSHAETHNIGETRQIRFATFAGDGGISEMQEKASSYGGYETSLTLANEETAPAPVAYWKFDEGYGTTANDSAGANNGTFGAGIAAPTWQDESMCISGKCLYFDGSDDYLNKTHFNSSPFEETFTLSFWARSSDFSQQSFPVEGQYGKPLVSFNLNKFSATLRDENDTTWLSHTTPTAVLTNNEWNYIAVVYYTDDTLKFYINGVLAGTDSHTGKIGGSLSDLTFQIGGRSTVWYQGYLDEVKIYPYARTADEIKADYVAGAANAGSQAVIGSPPETGGQFSEGLVGYWKMDESSWNGTSGEVIDSSGNGNHGTRQGDATTGSGQFGNGGSFDGTGDYINLGSEQQISSQNATASIWYKQNGNSGDSSATTHQFISANTYNPFNWLCSRNNRASYWINGGENNGWHLGTTDLSDNKWHHIALVFELNKNKTYSLYVDGNLESQETNSDGALNTTYIRYIATYDGVNRLANGTIDDVRVYNRALSPAEIRDLYNWASGPVGYWKFDEASTTQALDSSGNNIALTASGISSSNIINGKFGKAYYYNTWEDRHTGWNSVLAPNFNQITMEAWVYPKATPAERGTIILNTGSSGGVYLSLASNNSLQTYWHGRSSPGYHSSGANTVPNNQWSHVTVSWDAVGTKLYVNGILKNTVNATGTGVSNQNNLIIGAESSGRQFNGFIDDVRIYNYARTSAQIIEDMNAGHPIGGSPIGSQATYLNFNEGYGVTVHDKGTVGDNGTLYNDVTWTNNGKIDKAITFDGLNDMVANFTSDNFEYIGENMSFSLWVKRDGGDTDGGKIVSKPWNGSGQYNYRLETDSLEGIKLHLHGTTVWDSSTIANTLPADTWVHIAVTLNSNNSVKIYKNGAEIYSDTHTISSWTPSSGDGNVSLCLGSLYPYGGGWAGATSHAFKGSIDEFKFYRVTLTTNQALQEYNQGKSAVMGSLGTEADGTTPSFSSSREYCVPGDTTTCDPPIAEWKFDEKTGSTAYDTSGNGNTGTLTSMETSDWRSAGECKYGSCLLFDGSNEYVDFNAADIVNSSTGTIEAWIYAENWDANRMTIFSSEIGPAWVNLRFVLFSNSNNSLTFSVANGTSSAQDNCNTGTVLSNKTWYHVTGIYNGSNLKIYINGELKDTYDTSITPGTFTPTKTMVGWHCSDRYWNGKIDQVRIYNYARTPAQIAWDYNRGKPIGWWKFDEGEGTTAHDTSGNENNGTLTNMDPATDYVSGKINTALNFDGDNDYVELSNPSEIQIANNDFTASGWYYAEESLCGMEIIEKGNNIICGTATNGGWSLGAINGKPIFRVSDHTNLQQASITENVSRINEWVHLVGIKKDNTIKLYVNGSYIEQDNVAGFNIDDDKTLRIGGRTTAWLFNGSIDDVRVYNYALSNQQIKTLYNNGALNFR